ncbi:hypothetical protein Clacol_009908 [Clathrus columnatus]|uniref:Uncharacterized protein n=1 Tax=Clathrus columnatus TaxID=1419009 RepID=A0AAV5AMI0_9AGAM|nr:hypothetical protein Clacol_009908 [Clathrus columnatus]
MLKFVSIFVVATLWGPCLAGPLGPLEPSEKFTQGGSLNMAWTPDTTGAWKNTNIELMTGDNFDMIHLTTLASIDGTDATKTTLTVPCPSVTPHSAIYFLQYSAPGQVAWTGRIAIVGSDGTTIPPPNSTQPDGSDIPWGIGMLVPPSFPGTPPPSTAPPGQIDASGSSGSTGAETSSSNSSSGASSSSSSSSVTEGLGASVPSSSGSSSSPVTPTAVGPLPGETTPASGSGSTQPTSGSDTDSNSNSNSNSSSSSNSTTPTNTPKSNAFSLTHALSSLTPMSIFIAILSLGTGL